MSLPSSFSYFVNRMSGVSRKQVKIQPTNSTTIKNNQSVEWVLPDDSIVDLTTLEMRGNFKFQNASTATNVARYVPQPHTLIRSQTWSLNGQVVSGNSCQHYGQLYEAVRRSSVGISHDRSCEDEYFSTPVANKFGNVSGDTAGGQSIGTKSEKIATNTQARAIKCKAWWGLATAPNAPNWDTSIFGSTRLRLEFLGQEPILAQSDTALGSGDGDWEISDIHMVVDVLSFSDASYDMLMSSLLSEEGSSLLVPFNEYTSQLSLCNNSIKFNVSSQSLDMLGFACLKSTQNAITRVETTSGMPYLSLSDAGRDPIVSAHTDFCYRNASSESMSNKPELSEACSATFSYQINGEVYPSQGQTALQNGASFTKDLYSAGNQLYTGYVNLQSVKDDGTIQAANAKDVISCWNDNLTQYQARVNYLSHNCIVAMRLCADLPASQSPQRSLSGKNTLGSSSNITLNLVGFNNNNDNVLMFAQGSAVLEAKAGQAVAVQY